MSIQQIQEAITYMEEHIYEDINYVDVAKSVHMSGYNFHRTFSFVTGMTANEYIRSRRLTLAAQELQTTKLPVIDAAYKYGYESPESFSKAFSRFHGSTPKQAKQPGAKLHLFNPLAIKLIVEGGSIMDYRMEHRERQQFIAVVRAFPNEIINDDQDHSIPDFWTECTEKNLLGQLKALRPDGKKICTVCAVRQKAVKPIFIMVLVSCAMEIRMLLAVMHCWQTALPCGKRNPQTMLCLSALALTGTVWERHGAIFTRSLYHRQATRRQRIRTMKYILSVVRKGCSVNCGCQ